MYMSFPEHNEIRPLLRKEYDQMVDAGLFVDERIELIHGVLVHMSPQGEDHVSSVVAMTRLLILALDGRAEVRPQVPYAASPTSEPEPDLAVTTLPAGRRSEHPTSALLVVEVSDSSLTRDRNVKTPIYAENGVPEYWIVDIQHDVLIVHRDPADGTYRQVRTLQRGEHVTLLAFPDVTFAVDQILPALD